MFDIIVIVSEPLLIALEEVLESPGILLIFFEKVLKSPGINEANVLKN